MNLGEALIRILDSFDRILRYIAPGFVALFVFMFVSQPLNLFDGWIDPASVVPVVCICAALAGCAIYGIHTAVMIPLFWGAILFVKLRSNSGEEMMRQDIQRWLRRTGKNAEAKAVQDQLDRWSALQHYLYCSSYSMIAIPLFFKWNRGERLTTLATSILVLGVVTLCSAIFSEHRLTDRERLLTQKFPL